MPTPPKLTGRKRHRVLRRLFRKDVLVLQQEVEGFVPYHSGGIVECELQRWWVDVRPEQNMIDPPHNNKEQ